MRHISDHIIAVSGVLVLTKDAYIVWSSLKTFCLRDMTSITIGDSAHSRNHFLTLIQMVRVASNKWLLSELERLFSTLLCSTLDRVMQWSCESCDDTLTGPQLYGTLYQYKVRQIERARAILKRLLDWYFPALSDYQTVATAAIGYLKQTLPPSHLWLC